MYNSQKLSIADYGVATRFGAGQNCPRKAQQAAQKPWSIRQCMRRLMALSYDMDTMPVVTASYLIKHIGDRYGQVSLAQHAAITLFLQAFNGDNVAMQKIIRMVDGSLART